MELAVLHECYPEGVPDGFPAELFEPVPVLSDAGEMVFRDKVLRERIEQLQEYLLTLPQTETPVQNLIASGVYTRQIFIPKGTTIVGAVHLHDHINICLAGDLTLLTVDGPKRIKAPAMFVAPAGHKKVAFANEDTLWVNAQLALSSDPDEILALTTVKTYAEYDKFCNLLEAHHGQESNREERTEEGRAARVEDVADSTQDGRGEGVSQKEVLTAGDTP